VLEARIAGVTLLIQTSEGTIDATGLAPTRFVDHRARRPAQAANFRRDLGTVTYSGPALAWPLLPGTQDRLSWMIQLAGVAAAEPELLVEGGQVAMVVVGARAAKQRSGPCVTPGARGSRRFAARSMPSSSFATGVRPTTPAPRSGSIPGATIFRLTRACATARAPPNSTYCSSGSSHRPSRARGGAVLQIRAWPVCGAKEFHAMHMLYNSDSFTVVAIDIPGAPALPGEAEPEPRGGFEIVDKFAQKDIFIEGAMAQTFQAGAVALMEGTPSEEDIDEYIGRFTALMAQPLVVH
jgi:hypothetical protein